MEIKYQYNVLGLCTHVYNAFFTEPTYLLLSKSQTITMATCSL